MSIIFEILVVLGAVLFLSSVFYLKPGVPIGSLNPKDWVMAKQKGSDMYIGPGYRLNRS